MAPYFYYTVLLKREIGETLGWNGWYSSGYSDSNGTLHKGINAISAFGSDLTHEYQRKTVF